MRVTGQISPRCGEVEIYNLRRTSPLSCRSLYSYTQMLDFPTHMFHCFFFYLLILWGVRVLSPYTVLRKLHLCTSHEYIICSHLFIIISHFPLWISPFIIIRRYLLYNSASTPPFLLLGCPKVFPWGTLQYYCLSFYCCYYTFLPDMHVLQLSIFSSSYTLLLIWQNNQVNQTWDALNYHLETLKRCVLYLHIFIYLHLLHIATSVHFILYLFYITGIVPITFYEQFYHF